MSDLLHRLRQLNAEATPGGFDPSRGVLQYIRRWPRDPSPCSLVPLWAGEFRDFNDWVNFATKRLSEAAGDKYGEMKPICVDALGRRCTIGAHFMRARDEDAFPVRYFWECVPAESDDLRSLLPQIIAALELNKAAQDVFAAGFHAAERHGLGDDRDGGLALALEWAEFAALERLEGADA